MSLFTYPTSHSVNLDAIKLHLNRGDTLGIVGKTGSGKTTFVKKVCRVNTHPVKGKSSSQEYRGGINDERSGKGLDWLCSAGSCSVFTVS